MHREAKIGPEHYNQRTLDPAGYRDKRGEWRPENPVTYAPLFQWPARLKQSGAWLLDYLFKWNLFFFAITALTWLYFQPALDTCKSFRIGWIAQMFLRNMALLWIIYGGWHLYLYTLRKRGHRGKYSPRWQSSGGATFLFKDQVGDNIFWACASGCVVWTAYEVVTMWMYANGHIPYLDFQKSPVLFVAVLLLIPFWREFHFYWIHRLIHWKPLYDRIHYLHHYNINPGPWSGLAMHPVEHVLYFSVTLIHWLIPSHPLHFLYNAQHTALTPAAGHTGFEGDLTDQISFGSYFHYLHHRHFDCNYGESTIPLDKWFGSFNNGARTETEKAEARRTYHTYQVDRIVPESAEVKSFYLRRADGTDLEPFAPGQHLLFKVPAGPNGQSALRFYTLSDFGNPGAYRISVKREPAPVDVPGAPAGRVSNFLHDQVKVGDFLEARGPMGDFVPNLHSRQPLALIAGGIGITPILAMAKGCLLQRPNRNLHLFLAFREPRQQVFKAEIESLQAAHPNLKVFLYFDAATEDERATLPGKAVIHRLSIEDVKEQLPHLNMNFFICGPGPMMTAMIRGLQVAGVDEHRIHAESFHRQNSAGPQHEGISALHEVTFARTGRNLAWNPEFRNLLEFGESNGVSLDAGCMFGECGACATRIVSGEVEYNYKTATTPAPGTCLICSCRPKTALVLDA